MTTILRRFAILAALTASTTLGDTPPTTAFESALSRLDPAAAERAASEISRAGEKVTVPLARVAIHRGDAALALRLLEAARDTRSSSVRELRSVAQGLLHATLGASERRTPDGALRVQFQHPADEALLPLLHASILAARRVTQEVLGYTWTAPTYVVFVRDQQTLSEATGLPYESASTTGTLAIAKWGRVTMLSPRATESPVPWRDTVVHELAHLALTAVTNDHAPLWLQEGVAKDMETRWREREAYDEDPSPEVIVREAVARNEYLPLDKLGPSVAMLPSAHAAEVAFAAATSFVRYLRQELGREGFTVYLRALAEGGSDDALARSTGRSFSTWHASWLAATQRGAPAKAAVKSAHVDGDESAKRARLARLLVLRGHGDAALAELARTEKGTLVARERDGGWLTIHALAHERRKDDAALDRLLFAEPPATEPRGAWYRLRARRADARAEGAEAARDRARAVAREPYAPDAICEEGRSGPEAALCEAARARTAPNLD